MAKNIRAIMVGCGGMSGAWLGPLAGMDDIEIVALVDVVEKAARQRAEDFNIKDALIGTNLKSVLAQVDADVVFDCSIPEAHTDVTVTALKAGCHVLGEKPMADSMANARRSVRAAEKADRIYAVIQNRRYDESMRRLRRMISNKAVGPLTTVNCDFYIGAHFGGFRDHMQHVLLLDMAIHTFDQARMLTGADPVSVYCREWNPAGSWYDHDASAIAIFEMSDGLVFTYRGSWCAEGLNTSWESDWRFIGTRGTITWDGYGSIRAQRPQRRAGLTSPPRDLAIPQMRKRDRIGGHTALIREFVDSVRRGRKPETICTDNIKSLAMVFAAIDSARKNRPVAVTW
jgi:predicted dehydrogenase